MHDGRLMGGRWMDGGEVFLFDRYCYSVLGALEFGRGFLYSTSLLGYSACILALVGILSSSSFCVFSSPVGGLEVVKIVGRRALMDELLDCWVDLLGNHCCCCCPTLIPVS